LPIILYFLAVEAQGKLNMVDPERIELSSRINPLIDTTCLFRYLVTTYAGTDKSSKWVVRSFGSRHIMPPTIHIMPSLPVSYALTPTRRPGQAGQQLTPRLLLAGWQIKVWSIFTWPRPTSTCIYQLHYPVETMSGPYLIVKELFLLTIINQRI